MSSVAPPFQGVLCTTKTRSMPVQNATRVSKTSALWTRITKRCIQFQKWWWKYEIDIFLLAALFGGTIIFVMALRAIS